MESVKRLFQSLFTTISPITDPNDLIPSSHDAFWTTPPIGENKEVLNKIDRMARQPQSNPREYISLTPTQRLMYIVKKTEYYPHPKPRAKQTTRRNKRKQVTFPSLFPTQSPLWPQLRLTRPISKRFIIRSRMSSFSKRRENVAPNHGSEIETKDVTSEGNEKAPIFQGLKRSRPVTILADAEFSRAEKRSRYSDIEPVGDTKRSMSNNFRCSILPAAKKQRCFRIASRTHETVKQEMRAERWNRRLAYGNVSPKKSQHDFSTITAVCRGRGVFE